MTTQCAEMASYSGPTENLSELRIILLGYKMSGKSSSGNTILGSEEFKLERTAQCEKRQGDVAGRQVIVINTPGWWIHDSLKGTSELTKLEIVHSASLCPQGPHALLLVLRADSSDYKSIEEHMQLFGETVWSHTIILFTFGDAIGDRSIEQYIESGGEALQRLVEKCGHRYHVFNNRNRGDDTQVTELIEKIEIVAGGTGGCFEIDRRVLEETEKKRRTLDESAPPLQTMVTYTDYWSPSVPSLPLKKSRSKDIPPNMSEADLQQRWSSRYSLSGATDSDYGSQTSIYTPSPYSSQSSIYSPYGSTSSLTMPWKLINLHSSYIRTNLDKPISHSASYGGGGSRPSPQTELGSKSAGDGGGSSRPTPQTELGSKSAGDGGGSSRPTPQTELGSKSAGDGGGSSRPTPHHSYSLRSPMLTTQIRITSMSVNPALRRPYRY